MGDTTIRIPYKEMVATLKEKMLKRGFPEAKAELCGVIISSSSCDGVISHGIGRFRRLLDQVAEGVVDVSADPEIEDIRGSIQRWNGNHGLGISNAVMATDAAVSIAKEQGLGLIALRNTTHWLRGGSYGWRAADQSCAIVCWTNTVPNMPPWGSQKALIGNNPLVIGIPSSGGHLVLDMAMSQFSYGALGEYSRNGKMLPVAGGTAADGTLTTDPDKVLETGLVLPAGFWKGTALSIILDMLAASLSLGSASADIEAKEKNLSQVFLAISMDGPQAAVVNALRSEFLEGCPETKRGNDTPRYPGQRVLEVREKNLKDGIPVPSKLWEEILSV